jgi:hypothetical protein
MVEDCENRFKRDELGGQCDDKERANELLNLVNEVFPPAPTKPEDEVMKDARNGCILDGRYRLSDQPVAYVYIE